MRPRVLEAKFGKPVHLEKEHEYTHQSRYAAITVPHPLSPCRALLRLVT